VEKTKKRGRSSKYLLLQKKVHSQAQKRMSRILYLIFVLSFFGACKNDPKPAAAPKPIEVNDPELAALNALLAREPNNDSLLYRRAEAYRRLDIFDPALDDIAKALRIDSIRPAYYHCMADVLLDFARPNDSRRAIEVLKSAAQRFPESTYTLLKLSEFQLIVQQHQDALSTLDKILQKDPQNAEAFYMSGRVALDKRDTVNAIKALQKSVKIDAFNADAWFFLGRIFAERRNPLAVQYYDNALRVDSTNLEIREFKGAYFKRRGQFKQAFEVYRDIIRRDPDYSNAYFDQGMIYLELDSLQKAYDHFNYAVKTSPLFVKAYFYRGVAAEAMGNTAAALGDYVQANKMSPNWPEAKEARARLEKR
jgi:tetratricopeptide (TPR) repeat protein